MGRWKSLFWLALSLFGVAAQARSLVVDEPPRRAPQIWIDPALGTLQPIALADMQIDVRMTGFLAHTTIELSFYNPNDRVLEGELVFPLSSGQSITGYALEVDGKLRQGVVVPKETARVAFEEITRRGIDPGLAELTRGNVFRTRLYPIPARGHKRVRFSFDQPLLDAGAHWRYVLPLQFEQKIQRFGVRALAVRAAQAPQSPSHPDTLSFDSVLDGFIAELEQRDVQPQRELSFSIPKGQDVANSYTVADPLEPSWRTLASQVDTGLPDRLKAPAPRHIALYYDASGSAAQRDRARENRALEQWLQSMDQVRVDLIAFRDAADAVQRFDIRKGDSKALLEAIDDLAIDGGSSYGAIDLALAKGADTVMIIGDGLSNFAGDRPQLIRADGSSPRLIMLYAAQAADHALLSALARRHAGTVINLLELDPEQARVRLMQPQWSLLSVQTVRGACADFAPQAPQAVNRHFAFYARCKGAAQLKLVFGDGVNTERNVERRVQVDEQQLLEGAAGAGLLRLWAVAHIADLEALHGGEDPRITTLATRYGVVTAQTSMLVLDRIEDYVRYRVRPAEAELLAQYEQLLGLQGKQLAAPSSVDRHHLDSVLSQWRAFQNWHAQRHPWLESLLHSSVEHELQRWQALQSDPRLQGSAKAQLQALEKLHVQSARLQSDWSKAGQQADSRAAWEKQAIRAMLTLDQIRMARLQAWPESDSVDGLALQSASVGEAETDDAVMAEPMAELAAPVESAAPTPPPPRPAMVPAAASMRAAPGAGPADAMAQAPSAAKRDDELSAGSNAAGAAQAQAHIELAPWNPDTPYLSKLRAAQDPYRAYLLERRVHGEAPAFFLDCADFFRQEVKDDRLALRILSNLAELDLESAPLVRILAYRLSHWERFDLAIPLFETVLKLRAEEPQSRRDLALALSRAGQPDYPRAITLLWEVISRPWDSRFPDVGVIAVHELNDVLARMPAAARNALDLAKLGVEDAFVQELQVDLRVVLSWDADNTDIDLWVIDPSGETAIYSHPQTRSGGQMSRDFTGGYGPEVYTIKRALPGTYIVKAHYFGDRVQKLSGAVTVQVEFLTDFGGPDSKRQAVTRRLEGDEATLEVGRFVAGFAAER